MADEILLTIGIDARAATEVVAGRGRVVRELLRALAVRPKQHRYRCYARTQWPEPLGERFTWELIDARDPWWNLRAARAASHSCDVYLSTNSYLTTLFLTVPGVAVVYDLVTFDRRLRPNRRSAIIEQLTLGLATRRSCAFVAISHATADALLTRFPRCAGRTVVAHLGTSTTLDGRLDAAEVAQLPAPGFVLAVGTLEPRKNLPRLVDAYRRLPEATHASHPLVVVGELGWQTGETVRALESLGERVRNLGRVSDTELAELYRRCAVFCYPSLGEGFGLPVLEAMSAGAAVLTSNVSSLPEVGGDAVLYVDPEDTGAMSEQLKRLLDDEHLRASLRSRALERARRFSWIDFAELTMQTLERCAQVP